MTWNDIPELFIEIENLQCILNSKIMSPEIKNITKRGQKYCKDPRNTHKYLNNASLENLIKNTYLQVNLISRLKEENIPLKMNDIYSEVTDDLEYTYTYLTNKKHLLETVNEIFDIVLGIEIISEIEDTSTSFDSSTEYHKFAEFKDDIFIDTLLHHQINIERYIQEKITNYFQTLDSTQKQKLLLESLHLSYDRNAYDYIESTKLYIKIMNNKNISVNNLYIVDILYQSYKLIFLGVINKYLESLPLSTIAKDFSCLTEYQSKCLKKV